MEVDSEAPSPSLLNTEYSDLNPQAREQDSGSEESDYGLPSYQQPRQTEKPKEKKKAIKRKASEDAPSTTEAKIKKTEGSIMKLNEHLQKNTCPKALRYSARANIPADEQFREDIKSVKQKAERGFVEALTRFHYRRLEIQKSKLNKEKSTGHRKASKTSHSVLKPTKNLTELRAIATKLQKQYENVNKLMSQLNDSTENKNCEKYSRVSVKCVNNTTGGSNKNSFTKRKRNTAKRRERRNRSSTNRVSYKNDKGQKYIKNISNEKLTDAQITLISRGLKFIPTNAPNKNKIRRQLLRDFEDFARRMRLKYMFHGQNREIHPFYVKSDWNPPVQPSVALESYLEEVKLQLAKIHITKPKRNLSHNERKALNELKQNHHINLKKADKGSTTVVMNKTDKIREGQSQINDENNYSPLTEPMVKETQNKVSRLIANLHRGKHIDDMTKKWLSQTPCPPRIPEFYTLTKIHKPTLTGRPIISGCDGPTERISSFVDTLLQPISKSQRSYLKDTTDFINFIESTKVKNRTFLVSMDVTSLYTNIPQNEGIDTVCKAYDNFYKENSPHTDTLPPRNA